MKKIVVLFMCTAFYMGGLAQDFSKLETIKLSAVSDYKKAEPEVLKCADYILGQTITDNEANKLKCLQFIMRWMDGTADYSFAIDSDFIDFCGKDLSLSGVFMASLAKSALSEELTDKSSQKISAMGKELFLDYCAKPENLVKQNKAIKNALKARNS